MEFLEDLDAGYRPDSEEAWDARNRNDLLVKIGTALLPQNLASALPGSGLKRENGEWIISWAELMDIFGDLFAAPEASQKDAAWCDNHYSPLAHMFDPGMFARGWRVLLPLFNTRKGDWEPTSIPLFTRRLLKLKD